MRLLFLILGYVILSTYNVYSYTYICAGNYVVTYAMPVEIYLHLNVLTIGITAITDAK